MSKYCCEVHFPVGDITEYSARYEYDSKEFTDNLIKKPQKILDTFADEEIIQASLGLITESMFRWCIQHGYSVNEQVLCTYHEKTGLWFPVDGSFGVRLTRVECDRWCSTDEMTILTSRVCYMTELQRRQSGQLLKEKNARGLSLATEASDIQEPTLSTEEECQG